MVITFLNEQRRFSESLVMSNKVNSSFAGTRAIDMVVVMLAGVFFANVIFYAPAERSETISFYAAEIEAPLKTMD